MKSVTPYLFISVLFLSCQQNDQNKNQNNSIAHSDSLNLLAKNQHNTNDRIELVSITAFHKFSDSLKNDRFTLILKGDSILTGTVFFTIFDSENRIIHSESFAAFDLLWDNELNSIREKEDTIKARMKSFFSEANFIIPAKSIVADYTQDYTEKKIWEEVNSSNSAIGFRYTHGYEGTYAITYSRKTKKTILYFSTD